MRRILSLVAGLLLLAACQDKSPQPGYIVQVSLGGWHSPDYTAEQVIRIDPVFGRVLLDVQDGAVAVLDELVHLDGLLVAVTVVEPAVVDACDDVFTALDKLAGEAAHDVLGVGINLVLI